jgi:tellurite resistance protein TehA-like permease
MDSIKRQYLFALIFVGVGIYQATIKDYLEFSLYTIAGTAFILNALSLEPKLIKFKKPLVIITWVFMIVAALLFLYLLQFKF